ncbi:MAG: UDP-glucose 4-epimerase GalE [Hyphomicrobiales bacterium]|nr:MAG: UDP-glucose 4-epimerase GalE [Hyphomicrobiales bacterium]
MPEPTATSSSPPPVLVVGGAGYIGAHCCRLLAASGFRPVVYDNLTTGHADFVRWGPLIEGDIRDRAAAARALRDSGAEAVIHFAASAEVGESMIDPHKYYDNNVAGTLSLLGAMRDEGVNTIVFSSTCSLYGNAGGAPISEATPPAPVNPYGRTKWMIEQILSDFSQAHGFSAIALRYFNACGADLDGRIGEWHEPETHLIPRAMLALLGHVSDFTIFGNDYDTPDGTAIRDYIHVDDLARAHLSALRRLRGGHKGGAFNLGTGHGYSVRQVVEAIEAETGRRLPGITGPRRPGDPAVLIADAALARAELGFSPECSDLNTIIRTAWRWHLRHHGDIGGN